MAYIRRMNAVLSPGTHTCIRAATGDDLAMLAGFLADARLQFACFAPGHLRHGFEMSEEALADASLALSEEGEVLGLSLIESTGDPAEARLVVLLPPGQCPPELISELIGHAAAAARRLGIQRLRTGVLPQRASVIRAFERAGLRPMASMSLGGLAEVVLSVR